MRSCFFLLSIYDRFLLLLFPPKKIISILCLDAGEGNYYFFFVMIPTIQYCHLEAEQISVLYQPIFSILTSKGRAN